MKVSLIYYIITKWKGNGPGGPAGLQNPVAVVMRGLEGSTPSPFRHKRAA